MDIEAAIIFTDALKEYYNNELEFQSFCELYDVPAEEYGLNEVGFDASRIDYSRMARQLTVESELSNNRRFLDALMPRFITRCQKCIAETTYARRSYHEEMLLRLEKLQLLVGSPRLQEEITVPGHIHRTWHT